MNQGKILKIRMGHEANCSSGMVSGAIMIYACIGQLPVAIITSTVQAAAVHLKWAKIWHWLTWFIPQLLGVAFIVFYIKSSNYGDTEYGYEAITMSATIAASYGLAISLGYYLAPRLRSPFWLIPIIPTAFIVGIIATSVLVQVVLNFSSYYLGSVPGEVMQIRMVPWTPH